MLSFLAVFGSQKMQSLLIDLVDWYMELMVNFSFDFYIRSGFFFYIIIS